VEGFSVPDEMAQSADGYARRFPDDWLQQERDALAPLAARADAFVLGALVVRFACSMLSQPNEQFFVTFLIH
jgi:NAD/NADP transhydrogenase alpha subunit